MCICNYAPFGHVHACEHPINIADAAKTHENLKERRPNEGKQSCAQCNAGVHCPDGVELLFLAVVDAAAQRRTKSPAVLALRILGVRRRTRGRKTAARQNIELVIRVVFASFC